MGRSIQPDELDLTGSAIVLTYHHNSSTWFVKHWYMNDPFRSYLNAMRLIFRLVLSLRRVATKLPIYLLISGERHEPFEKWLSEHGVHLLPSSGPDYGHYDLGGERLSLSSNVPVMARPKLPAWANRHFRGTFSKLQVLSLVQFQKVILVDADMVALRNIDHLALAPTPAVAFRWDCRHPEAHILRPTRAWEMNSGMLVLQPNIGVYMQMIAMLNNVSTSQSIYVMSDPSDQSVWRHLFRHVFELPQIYNAQKHTNFSAWGWKQVSLLHDIDVHRGLSLPNRKVDQVLSNITTTANQAVREVCESAGIRDRG